MSTVKVIELIGESDSGWDDAVRSAVRSASKTIHDLICVDVVGWTGSINDKGEITQYRANVKVAFKVKE